MELVVPTNLPGKRRRITQEMDRIWQDEQGNYILREFTEEEEAEWAVLDELTAGASKFRMASYLVVLDHT
jgi:hypothetical protein